MAGPGMYVKHWSCEHVAYALCINCCSGSGLLAAAMGAAVRQGMGAAVRAAVEAAVEAVGCARTRYWESSAGNSSNCRMMHCFSCVV